MGDLLIYGLCLGTWVTEIVLKLGVAHMPERGEERGQCSDHSSTSHSGGHSC
jgi:hypothetical protein